MSEEEILELKEQCLPEYLKHDIEEYKKMIKVVHILIAYKMKYMVQ